MTTSGPGTTYRHVADGRLVSRLDREGVARLLRPGVVVAFVLGALMLGVVLSFAWSTAELPRQLAWVFIFGVAIGLVVILVGGIAVVAVSLPVARAINRKMARPYQAGSVTEVEVGDDSLTIRRSTGGRTVPYASIFRVRPAGSFLRLELRGRLAAELLPIELLPDDAVEFIRTRARGAWPTEAVPDAGTPTRQMVVPSGWASHVAAVYTGYALRYRSFWIRVGVASVISAVLAFILGWAWLLIVPAVAVVLVVVTYEQARRTNLSVLPVGSVATTHFFEDRLVSRNTGGVREVRFDDVSSVDVLSDVVILGFASQPGRLLIARAMIPPDTLEQLRRRVVSSRGRGDG